MILDSSLRSATFRMTECQHYLGCVDILEILFVIPAQVVIPAKAGIQIRYHICFQRGIDSRFRGNGGKCQHCLGSVDISHYSAFPCHASEAWNLKVCACAMILDSSLRSATFRMTECQHYLVTSDQARRNWAMSGPHHAGSDIFHMAYDDREDGTFFVGINYPVWGPEIQRSHDLGATWRNTNSL